MAFCLPCIAAHLVVPEPVARDVVQVLVLQPDTKLRIVRRACYRFGLTTEALDGMRPQSE